MKNKIISICSKVVHLAFKRNMHWQQKARQKSIKIKSIPTNIWNGASMLDFGGGTCVTMTSSNCAIFFASAGGSLVKVVDIHPSFAEA